MNQGILAGNAAPDRFAPDNYYTGYWGSSRQLSGLDNPGEVGTTASHLVQLENVTLPNSTQILTEYPTPWAVLANEVPFDVEAFEIHPRGSLHTSGSSIVASIDVAYGAVGHETVIVDRFYCGARNASTSGAGVSDVMGPFPVKIPAGSRVVMRVVFYPNGSTNAVTVTTMLYQPFFYRRYPRPGTKGVTLPVGHPNPTTRLANPGGADVDSAWTNVGTVPFDTHWVVPCPMVGSSVNTYGSGIMVFDWAYVDDTGTEVVIVDNVQLETNTSEWMWTQPRPYPVNLPAGTLIRARGKYDTATSGTATFMVPGLTCIGVEDVDPARRPGQSQIVG